MRKWIRRWIHRASQMELEDERARRELEFPHLHQVKGTGLAIKEIHNGFLISFNTQNEDDWLQKVVYCKTPDDIAHELVRHFTVKTMVQQ